MHPFRHLRCLAAVMLVSLGACGGGGAGTAGAPGPGGTGPATPPPAVSASGLVPDAGAAGATLYADASTLRVLRDGAVWTYRGIDQPRGTATAASEVKTYSNTVKQTAAAGGTVEDGSNPFNDGPDTTSPVRIENGAVKYSVPIALVAGTAPQSVDLIELRSPVRANDQYVSLDQHLANSVADVDGDKVNEALDIALYTRVIGEETIDLPNRRQVKAVRVDSVMRGRVTYSKNGATSPLLEATQSIWYAPGLGVVKSREEVPNDDPALPNRIVTEVLENWDGLTEGLGHAATVAAVAPAGSPLAGAALQYPLDAVAFDSHAVVASFIPGQPSAVGVALSQLDNRGKVVAARSYTRAELFPAAQFFSEPRLLRVGSELRLFARTDNVNLSMVALDATGQTILRPAVTVLSDPQFGYDYENTSYRLTADGNGIWVGWVRINSMSQRSVMVRHFDASGQAAGAERALLDPVMTDISELRMALADTRLGLSWKQSGLQPVRHAVTVDTASGAVVADKLLASDAGPGTRVETVALQPGIAMASWIYPVGPLGVARLDANGDPVLSVGATLATDTLKAPWLAPISGIPVFSGVDGQLVVSAPQAAKYWPEDALDSGFLTVFQTAGTSGPLAASEPVLLARIPDARMTVLTTLRLGNRLLLVGSDGAGYLDSIVVWLPH